MKVAAAPCQVLVVDSAMYCRSGSSLNSGESHRYWVRSRISVGTCQVPSSTNCSASSAARSSLNVSTACCRISTSAGVERLTGLITTLRSTRIRMRSMNGSLTLGSRSAGRAAIASASDTSSVEQPAMIVRPGPRCSIARMPAREALATSMPAGRCPATGMPSLLASATAGKKTSGVISAILMKSAPCAAWSRTAATAAGIVPALSGVSSAPGSASTSGESGGSGSVPAERSRRSSR